MQLEHKLNYVSSRIHYKRDAEEDPEEGTTLYEAADMQKALIFVVLDKVGMQKPELLQLIQRRKLAYYGHIKRHCSIQKRVVEGKVEGKRGRGRKRQSWLANIQETSQIRLSVACEAALDRGRWRRMIAHLGDGTAQR
ncbi:hypothetical protein EGW08_021608 [Elysia chlorotica]|uniref:Uncharacterized protein n=1 Tax=Elysia chlorotica TaxID=188477 RepID=A0A3S1AYP8_ELYCH|nr:hypothetical protein EGW08_021608 [Elysia chlorotica]